MESAERTTLDCSPGKKFSDRDNKVTSVASSTDTSDEDGESELPPKGLTRFRGNSQDETAKPVTTAPEGDTITRFSTESLYSYSFTPMSRMMRAAKSNRQSMARGMDCVHRIKYRLTDRDKGRRYSQPSALDMRRWKDAWQTQEIPDVVNDQGQGRTPLHDFITAIHTSEYSQHRSSYPAESTPASPTTAWDQQEANEADGYLAARQGSLATELSRNITLPPIDETKPASIPVSELSRLHRSVHAPTRFLPQNQAIFTTNATGNILLFNDIASLCFGIEKSYVGKSILEMIEPPVRQSIRDTLSRSRDANITATRAWKSTQGLVLICGSVVPIIKANGTRSAASLWLKVKESGADGPVCIWVFEEIYESSLSAYVDAKGTIIAISGLIRELYGYTKKDLVGQSIRVLIPGLSAGDMDMEMENMDFEIIDRYRFYGSQSKWGGCFPVMIHSQQQMNQTYILKIISLPTIAGVVTVHLDGTIQSTSPVPAKYLFGYQPEEMIEKMNISQLLPQMPTLIQELKGTPAFIAEDIINNHTCRRVLSRASNQLRSGEYSHGLCSIQAVHRDRTVFTVQLQLRRIESDGESLLSIWVTYDRLYASSRSSKNKNRGDYTATQDPLPHRSPETDALSETKLEHRSIPTPSSSAPPEDEMSLGGPKRRPMLRPYGITSYGSSTNALLPETRFNSDSALPQMKTEEITPSKSRDPLEDYVIVGTLGEGAYGTAKLAYLKENQGQKKCVIKYIAKSRIIIDSWIRDRQRGSIPLEIHIMLTLQRHPHVNCCRLLKYLEDEDYYFMIMEMHGEGMDLFDYIEMNEHISEREVKAIFRQVADAVHHLHNHNIVHRDIKDENILLDEDGTVHLIDFGCAAYFRPGRTFDTYAGTLEYSAPEILKGNKYEGPPQDVWSLGILLYTLIFRETPFYSVDEILEHDLKISSMPYSGPMKLLSSMLSRDLKKRPTIEMVLQDEWLR
ncbi:uncharacterized protein BYT42DRAFT_561091 [Radiomyces spectabilis]|uniref:uncharacterized protein n=1 Tax=Radiomyces spectabilis TaxID=64574 RepID=UPI002220D0F4|nr:uncharacterized protein BYT42DRAFT_561091 [Radiomyces spectabilis]KAI8388746.1 hypothetical protein BYT42DRAFT_561091 [Radiomyces spectabilis]